jgi:hypothetical protein
MIIMAVSAGVIVVVLAWAGWYDYRRRRRGARSSVAENARRQAAFSRQRAIDGSKLGNAGPDPGGGV